jgi:hypothetical protein
MSYAAMKEVFGRYDSTPRGHSYWREPTGREAVDDFETYKSAMRYSHASPMPKEVVLGKKAGESIPISDALGWKAAAEAVQALADIEKSVSPDVLASIAGHLESVKGVVGDLNKEWLSGSPLASGLVAYDLQAPAKFLVPRDTPLVTRTPRTTQGVGTTARFKLITGVSNSQTGGVANVNSFFNSESQSTTFGAITLRRPTTISYAAADQTVNYMEQGLSDSVSYKAFFQSMGFENLKQLSQTSLLWATKLAEEQNLLMSRGTTANGFTGAIAAPTAVTIGANEAVPTSPVGGQSPSTIVGNSGNIATLYIYVQAIGGPGQSLPSTVASTATFSAASPKTAVASWADSVGALGYAIYAGTATGIANAYFMGTSQGNSFTLSFGGGGTGGCPSTGVQPLAGDSSANTLGYDGFLTVLSNPALAGYVNRLNSTFSSTNPATEFQEAFSALYNNGGPTGAPNSKLLARPNVIWIYAQGRVALSDLLKTNPSGVGYRLVVENTEANQGVALGSLVTGVVNEVVGGMVDLQVHPYMPNGCAIVHSETLPIPDSQVTNTVEVRNVVDYTAFDWPDIQMSYDASTYMLGAPVFYAPAWSGTILGILN